MHRTASMNLCMDMSKLSFIKCHQISRSSSGKLSIIQPEPHFSVNATCEIDLPKLEQDKNTSCIYYCAINVFAKYEKNLF